ncbi:MAG: prepilin-type N-terminal cleavage/methylation domain-containing protein [Patescibacteria group bacterium]
MKILKRSNRKKSGFLLIELMIAIGIMAIISGVTLIGVIPQLQKGRDAKVKEDFIQIRNALTQYYDDTGCFPVSLPSCGQSFTNKSFVYYSKFPCNWFNVPYVYQTDGLSCPKWYKLLTNLENLKDSSIGMSGCKYGCGAQCDYNYGLSSSNVKLNENCVQQFSCSPSGSCVLFADPKASRCPEVYENDPTCQNQCSKTSNQCHDERGKKN